MSSHTMVWVHPLDGEALDVASVRVLLVGYLDESGLSHDTLTSLSEACASALPASSPTLFFLNSWMLIEVFGMLASFLPHASFAVRGVGEEHRDIWVREYADGVVTFEAGPFHD